MSEKIVQLNYVDGIYLRRNWGGEEAGSQNAQGDPRPEEQESCPGESQSQGTAIGSVQPIAGTNSSRKMSRCAR